MTSTEQKTNNPGGQDETLDAELHDYQQLLSPLQSGGNATSSSEEELKVAPLIWWNVKSQLDNSDCSVQNTVPRGTLNSVEESVSKTRLQQYAVLGHVPDETTPNAICKPVLLNTNSPWSAFLCGSQGSGKSHALSCMLENCLLQNTKIGKNPHPLAGLVFHYDGHQSSGVCEAAYLCSSIPTTVLVSESNFQRLKLDYESMAARHGGSITVEVMKLLPKHLDTERMKTLMAVGKDGELPLYMHLVIKILRDMAIKRDRDIANQLFKDFNYTVFKTTLKDQGFTDKQNGPLDMRLSLLDSFINTTKPPTRDMLIGQPGTLTIIDLTDPVVDADSACVLFDICLSVFVSQTKCSKVVALDEAHNYMTDESTAAKQFTAKLLKTIREQRHQATRVVVATQEPTINTALLDLCSITMVHRCTSPAWFQVLKRHVAGLFLDGGFLEEKREDAARMERRGAAGNQVLKRIVQLELGESLLFCPTAVVGVRGSQLVRMSDGFVTFKTRARVTADGGVTRLAGDGRG